jgi:hypothetical protein
MARGLSDRKSWSQKSALGSLSLMPELLVLILLSPLFLEHNALKT